MSLPHLYSRNSSLPTIDLSHLHHQQVIVADGSTEYQGHPTTVLMPDGNTVFCVWTIDHGGRCGLLKKSADQGKTWSALLPVPEEWQHFVNCPCIWHLPTVGAPNRLAVYAQEPNTREIYVSVSPDGGTSWGEMTPCGIVSVMPFTTIIPGAGGRLLGMTNARCPVDPDPWSNIIIQAWSDDHGITWSTAETAASIRGAKLCEPWVIPSPDGKEFACLLRVNNRAYSSMIMFSQDGGRSWTAPVELPKTLMGDRHIARYLPDGRIMAVFRDVNKDGPSYGHFCGWIGTWGDLKNGNPGQFRLKLLQHYADSPGKQQDQGYPGLEVFTDGSVLATTYLRYRPQDSFNSVVAVRLTPGEIG